LDNPIFIHFQELLQERCGLHFPGEKLSDLERGLTSVMASAGISSVDEFYLELYQSSILDPLWKQFVNQLTIGETYFFRNRWHFKALRESVLPRLIDARRRENNRSLRIWCAGCSTGEEPYSIAILLHELIRDMYNWHISILATDINEPSLERARKAVYNDWSFRIETPSVVRDAYFRQGDEGWALLPEIRRSVHFEYLNLVEDVYPTSSNDTINMDMILCRNVTIYFDRSTTRTIINRFHRALVDGGWLIVGHSEPLASIYNEYEVHNFENAVLYRKSLVKEAAPAPELLPDFTSLSVDIIKVSTAELLTSDMQQTRLDAAYKLVTRGDFVAARDELTAVLELNPAHIDALFLLAKLSADEGHLDEVHDILDTIEELNPLVPQAHYLRALLHQQDAAWDDAKAALRRAIYAEREFALAHYHMGELLVAEGNATLARRSLQSALKLLRRQAPDSPVAFGDGTMVGTLIHAIEQRLNTL
jgi:chemotaxis protein methyltransferase CheR